MKTVNALTLSAAALTLFTTACIKTYIPTPPPPPSSATLKITSINPTSGATGISDTITGTGFSTALVNDSVFFNGKSANIISASATQLIVTVPAGVSTGYVSVAVSGRTATGPIFTLDTDTANYANDTAYMVTTIQSGTGGYDMVMDANGNFFVAGGERNIIWKITPAGIASTFAGSGQDTSINGIGVNASFHNPQNIAIDPSGNFYVTEQPYNDIRKITPDGTVSTYAGSIWAEGWTGGSGATSTFYDPTALSSDNLGNLFVFDHDNAAIRKITPGAAMVSTVDGWGEFGTADGAPGMAAFGINSGLCADASNNIWMCDQLYNTIRKLTPSGAVTTIAGTADRSNNVDSDGVGSQARFLGLNDIAVDKYGNLYVTEGYTVRKITPAGVVKTIAGTYRVPGYTDGPGQQATFENPTGIVVASNGVIYVLDGNIRVLTPQH